MNRNEQAQEAPKSTNAECEVEAHTFGLPDLMIREVDDLVNRGCNQLTTVSWARRRGIKLPIELSAKRPTMITPKDNGESLTTSRSSTGQRTLRPIVNSNWQGISWQLKPVSESCLRHEQK